MKNLTGTEKQIIESSKKNIMELYIVTKQATCKVVAINDKRINRLVTALKKVNEYENHAIAYWEKHPFSEHTTDFQTWNGQNNGDFEKYLVRNNVRTKSDCIEQIKKDAVGK